MEVLWRDFSHIELYGVLMTQTKFEHYRGASSKFIQEEVEQKCEMVFGEDDEIHPEAMAKAMGQAAKIVVDEVQNILKTAVAVETLDEWNGYESLRESHRPNSEYFVQILPIQNFTDKQLKYCMYLVHRFFTKKLCLYVRREEGASSMRLFSSGVIGRLTLCRFVPQRSSRPDRTENPVHRK